MGKFVLHTLSVRIANHVTGQMQLSKDDFTSTTARQLHLARMAQLYTKTRRLCEELQEEIPMDIATKNQLRKVPKELFQPYIRTYQALEYRYTSLLQDARMSQRKSLDSSWHILGPIYIQ